MIKKILARFEGGLVKRAEQATAQFREHVQRSRAKTLPLRIELVPATQTEWLDARAAREITQFLSQAGFEPAGVVMVKGNEQVIVAGFAARQHAVYATLPRSAGQFFVAFSSHFTDGRVFEAAHMPMPFEPPRPDWMVRKQWVSVPVPMLWANFLAERPAGPMVAVSPGGFAASNEEDFFRYQKWAAERGGATREELAPRFQASGKLPAGEAGEEFLDLARSDEADSALCNWWRLQPDAPAPLEQVKKDLVIIHDDLSVNLLLNAYWCATRDFTVKSAEFAEGGGREAFARVVANHGAPLRRVYQKRTGFEADFYLPQTG